MKKFIPVLIGVGLVCLAASAATFPTNPARAVIGGGSYPNTFTNLVVTNSISASSTNTLTSQPQVVVPGYDVGLEVSVTGGGVAGTDSATSSSVVFYIAVNTDGTGTNWTTLDPLSLTVALSGTAPVVVAYTNFPAATLSSASYYKLDAISNVDTNALTVSHVRFTRAKKPVQPPGLQ